MTRSARALRRSVAITSIVVRGAALAAVAAAVVATAPACLPVSLDGRRCAASTDCIEDHHCAIGVCLPNARNPAAAELLNDDCTSFTTDPGADVMDEVADATAVQLIGSLLPLTKAGVDNPAGAARTASIELAARQLAAAGGVFGRRLVVLACNSDGDVDTARRAMEHIAAAGIPAVIGEAASGITQAVFTDVAKPAGILMVAPSSTSVNLTGLDDDGLLFRTTVSDARQGAALARFLLDGGFERIAVAYSSETYGATLQANVRGALCADHPCTNPARYLQVQFDAQPDADAVAAVVADLAPFAPSALLIIGQDVEVKAVLERVAATPALARARILLTDTAKKESVLGGLPKDVVDRVVGTAPAAEPDNQVFRDWTLEMDAVFGRDAIDSFGPHAYDAALTVALAHVAHGDALHPTGEQLAAAIPRLSTSGAAPIELIGLDAEGNNALQKGLGILQDGEPIDVAGASGPLDFDEHGDVAGDIELWRRCDRETGAAPASLGVVLTAANEARVVQQACPSCSDVGCPAGTECTSLFGSTPPDPGLCFASCTAGVPCTTRGGTAGGACVELALGARACVVLAPLNAPCGDRQEALCDPAALAASCLRDDALVPGMAEGHCVRRCDPANATTCADPGVDASTCGCTVEAPACSDDVLDGADGVCAVPALVGAPCSLALGAPLQPCTDGSTCVEGTCR